MIQTMRGDGSFADQVGSRCGRNRTDLAQSACAAAALLSYTTQLWPRLGEPAHHVRSHAAEADHSDFHVHSSRCAAAALRDLRG